MYFFLIEMVPVGKMINTKFSILNNFAETIQEFANSDFTSVFQTRKAFIQSLICIQLLKYFIQTPPFVDEKTKDV